MTPTPPDILQRIVAQRRLRYGVAALPDLAFPFNESLSASSSSSKEARSEAAKAFIEGENEDEDKDRDRDERRAAPGAAFVQALRRRRGAAVIAEVKLGSPRLGSIADRVVPERVAAAYAAAGAAALSVVVEPDFFGGSHELLRRCRDASGLPAVAKDFVVSERQLDEAVAAGAGSMLLIAALYSVEELCAWAGAVRARGMAPLIETHSRDELARLAAAGDSWELVGVNNRDLRTFEVDLERSIALRPLLPAGALAVAESGIGTGSDVAQLAAAGFDAFLIGEALLLAPDPGAKLAELLGETSG